MRIRLANMLAEGGQTDCRAACGRSQACCRVERVFSKAAVLVGSEGG